MISFSKEIKVIAEFLGTFLLVLFGTGAIILNEKTNGLISHLGVSMVFGFVVFAMIVIWGKISGAHINPAVSIGLLISNKLEHNNLWSYIIAQVAGALTASFILSLLFVSNQNLGATLPSGSQMQSFFTELIATFVLVQVILMVDDSQKFRKHIALIVGLVIFAEAFLLGPISGASMNPARSMGPAIASKNISSLWIYIFAPVLGAGLAAFVHKFNIVNQFSLKE